MMNQLLNPQQQVAVDHVEGPLLVLAGAGSGKTRIVTHRIAHLLQMGVPSTEILAVTFTNKAAAEMRHRILQLTHQAVLTCTFHSLCAKILRESITELGFSRDFSIYDEEDSEKVIKECLIELNVKDEKGLLRGYRAHISQAKNALISPDAFSDDDPTLKDVYALYQKKLKSYNALDFDDLLGKTIELFQTHAWVREQYQKRWSFILIDEYQDTNAAQYGIVKFLASQHRNVFAVGDPDQSIYSWRGADIHNILNFEQDFPGAKVIPLEQNYRSRSNILGAANALIAHNASRYEKRLWSDRGEGPKIGLFIADSDRAEAGFVVEQLFRLHRERNVPLNDCVIFYRTNFQSRIFEDQLLKERVQYVIVGGLSFYQRKEIKDVLSILRMVVTGADFLAFARTINLPKRGIGETTLAKLQGFANERQQEIFATCQGIVSGASPFKLSTKAYEGLRDYIQMIEALRTMVQLGRPLHEVITEALERSRYLEYLREDPDSYEERRENVEELVSKAAEWEQETPGSSLVAFLEELSLKSSADEKDPSGEQVRLMTLHHGKGLEFAAVFLVGMEENLFPHANSLEKPEALEEERRLCYVGMTRAKEFLYLTCSRTRFLWGMPRLMRPSRFIQEIPDEFFHPHHHREERAETVAEEGEERGYAVGQQVLHKDFGTGIVQKSYKTSLGLTYDVFFPKASTTRCLVARFAKLIAVSN